MFAADALGYLRERMASPRIALWWVLLTTASGLAAAAPPRDWLPLALGCAWFLLVFRLWDDCEDLAHDRRHHPERRLVHAWRNRRQFQSLLGLLGVGLAGFLAWFAGPERVAGLAALAAVLLVVYRRTAARPRLRPLRAGLVLGKYPAWVFLLAAQPWTRVTLAAALATYLLAMADELPTQGPAMLPANAAVIIALLLAWVLAV